MPRIAWLHDHDNLSLRLRPLREQWEARGPGLLVALRRSLDWLVFPDLVQVQLTLPQNGGGRVESRDTISFEAVLVNPMPQLPEVVRLGWLISQLAVETSLIELVEPANADAAQQRDRVATALVPYILEAAEFVELAVNDATTTESALTHWLGQGEIGSVDATSLSDWWKANSESMSASDWWQRTQEL